MLRGPRTGVIFFRKGVRSVDAKGEPLLYDLQSKINQAVLPGLQGKTFHWIPYNIRAVHFSGGSHNNAIAAVATAMKQSLTPQFKAYVKQIIANTKRLSDGLQSKGYTVVTRGSETNIVLINLESVGLTGAEGEHILEAISIACNKCCVPGDKNSSNFSGISLGMLQFINVSTLWNFTEDSCNDWKV